MSKEPFVTVIPAVEVKAEPSVQPPPAPSNMIMELLNEVPLVVIVLPVVVELNVTVAPKLQLVPATKDNEPLTAREVPDEKVTVPAETVRLLQVAPTAPKLTV